VRANANGFLRSQFRYLLRTYPLRRSWRHKAYIAAEAVAVLLRYVGFHLALRPRTTTRGNAQKNCAVILLSHNRPQNLPLLVEGALRLDFVTKVVVSNSNGKVVIADWITACDPRLQLIDEAAPTRPGHRFVLAERQKEDCFISVDDDIFLTPGQWARFFDALLSGADVPHGITGQMYLPGTTSSNGSPFHHFGSVEKEVDVLIGAYAFTRKHLEILEALAAVLGLGSLTDLANGEDILLSFAGARPPRIHDLGSVFYCASASLPGVALWKTLGNFWAERCVLFERARNARAALRPPFHCELSGKMASQPQRHLS